MEIFRRIALSAAAVLFGIALYRCAFHKAAPVFAAKDWPSRGSGEVVIEFFDPSCGFAREFHQRLRAAYQKRSFHWTIVPVAIAVDARPAAAAMCEFGDAAMSYADDISMAPSQVAQVADATPRCVERLAVANQYFASITNNQPSVPTVLFRGKVFQGLDDFDALALALETLP